MSYEEGRSINSKLITVLFVFKNNWQPSFNTFMNGCTDKSTCLKIYSSCVYLTGTLVLFPFMVYVYNHTGPC